LKKGGFLQYLWSDTIVPWKTIKKKCIGVIINKFRGDHLFFDKGIKIIEKEFRAHYWSSP